LFIRRQNIFAHPFPHLGSPDTRKQYTLYFNQMLKKYCQQNDFLFIDIYDSYADKDGFLNGNLSDGKMHIKDVHFLQAFLKKHNIV